VANILLAEDDVDIAAPLIKALQREGHEVKHVIDGRDAEKFSEAADMLILDLGLPGRDGLDVCRNLRAAGHALPILMLSARADELDLVIGLDAGADDYVAKPFRASELMARIRAALRRSETPQILTLGQLVLEPETRKAFFGDSEILFTPKEFDLIVLLAAKSPVVVSREEILRDVWQTDWFGAQKTVDMHISSIRKKLLAAGAQREMISTARGIGFRATRP
jgi:DNA-binding response OmpR family regulator